VMAIFLQSVGAMCYAYVLGGICEYIASKDPATGEFNQSVDGINSFMQAEQIPKKLRAKTREFFRHAKAVIRSRYYDRSLDLISGSLRGELISNMHYGWLHTIKFFQNVPVEEKTYFVGSVARVLKMETLAQSERLVRPGEVCEQMYILHGGLVGMLGRVLGRGQVIGQDLILNLYHPSCRRHYTALALTYVQCYVLSSENLGRVLFENDLQLTKEVMRKNALKLCFCRTLISVAQSRGQSQSVKDFLRRPISEKSSSPLIVKTVLRSASRSSLYEDTDLQEAEASVLCEAPPKTKMVNGVPKMRSTMGSTGAGAAEVRQLLAQMQVLLANESGQTPSAISSMAAADITSTQTTLAELNQLLWKEASHRMHKI